MTKADLLAAISHLPEDAEIWLATKSGVCHTSCIIRVADTEIWLGDRSTLREEIAASETPEPEEDILWHDPADLPPPAVDLAAIALAIAKS